MKNAKLALIVALVMVVLRSGVCAVMLVFGAISLSHETNRPVEQPLKMQGTVEEQLQAEIQQAQAAAHEWSIHYDQMALHWEIVGLVWNLLLAGLVIFAISRFPKSN